MKQASNKGSYGDCALIALGANATSTWGNPLRTLTEAIGHLERAFDSKAKTSHFYLTPAFPINSGPDFVNAAVSVRNSMDASAIMHRLHAIEELAGRTREIRWGPRTLDLDLLAVGQQVLPDEPTFARWRDLSLDAQKLQTPDRLILPHPRLQDRSFVLVPLADIAPDWQHPVLGVTVAEMLAARSADERTQVRRLD